MIDLINGALQFPTVVFSVLLGIALVYWVLVLLGVLDLDLLDMDADLGLESDLGLDSGLNAASGPSGWLGEVMGAVGRLDLGAIPLTVSLSVWLLSCWTLTYLAQSALGALGSSLVVGGAVAMAAAFASLVVTLVGVLPLRRVFQSAPAMNKRDLVGQTCVVTTRRVTEDYGQAEIVDGDAAGMIIQVRSSADGELEKGTTALIFGYDQESDEYRVKAMTPVDESGL